MVYLIVMLVMLIIKRIRKYDNVICEFVLFQWIHPVYVHIICCVLDCMFCRCTHTEGFPVCWLGGFNVCRRCAPRDVSASDVRWPTTITPPPSARDSTRLYSRDDAMGGVVRCVW